MQRIRFRAWDEANREMYDVKLLQWEQHGEKIAEGQDPVMQYTGLNDKNGKPIFEGDILKSGKNPWIVEFIGSSFMMHQNYLPFLNGERFIHERVEIIGNIYENPELLTPP